MVPGYLVAGVTGGDVAAAAIVAVLVMLAVGVGYGMANHGPAAIVRLANLTKRLVLALRPSRHRHS
jgi:hypothetical protein